MTVCTLQSSKPPKALKQYHFSSGLVNAVLIVCSTCFEIFCSVLKINKKVTSVMHRHSIYRHKQYFLQSSHAYPHQGYITESKLSVGRIELVHALIYRGGKKSLTMCCRGRNRDSLLFSQYRDSEFQYILPSHFEHLTFSIMIRT